jgi:hypothetical protein
MIARFTCFLLRILGLFGLLCSTACAAVLPAPKAVIREDTLYVNPKQELHEISPYVYGSAYGPWVGVPFELFDAAKDSGITYLRYPGGEWGDQNNLKPYQIDQFMDMCKMMGAEPKINVRMPGGSAEQAADLVRYTNIEHDYNVRYWAIGNEPSLYTGYSMYEDFDTVKYNQVWREFAKAMLAVDPEIILIGPETHQYTGIAGYDPVDENGVDWMDAFLEANGDLVDIVSIHRYPFPESQVDTKVSIADLRENSKEWDEIIPRLRSRIKALTGRDIPIAVSEINSDWTHAIHGEATPDSFYNAIWWGDVLGRLIRQDVEIVAHFILQSNDGQGGWGLLGRFDNIRPSYYVYQLFQQFGETFVYASSDDPYLSIYAAKRADGSLTLIVINLDDEAKEKMLDIKGFRSASIEWSLFDETHQAEHWQRLALDSAARLEFPAQSISLLKITK